MVKIAWATCDKCRDLIPSEQEVVKLLEQQGIAVIPAIWDDAHINWSAFSAVIIRTTWDYHLKISAFLRWLDHLDALNISTHNPTEVIRWNHHKFYLKDLQDRGINIIPSKFVGKGNLDPVNVFTETGWDDIIIKPAISATAYDLMRIKKSEVGNKELLKMDQLTQLHDLIIQRFQPEVVSEGEWSFVFIDKEFSHAVLKQPKQGDFRVQNDFGGSRSLEQPDHEILEQVKELVSSLEDNLLYIRVDGIVEKNQFILMELELIEPELYLMSPEVRETFAQAIIKRCKSREG